MHPLTVTFASAIREAQEQAMKIDPNVFVFGLGVEKPDALDVGPYPHKPQRQHGFGRTGLGE